MPISRVPDPAGLFRQLPLVLRQVDYETKAGHQEQPPRPVRPHRLFDLYGLLCGSLSANSTGDSIQRISRGTLTPAALPFLPRRRRFPSLLPFCARPTVASRWCIWRWRPCVQSGGQMNGIVSQSAQFYSPPPLFLQMNPSQDPGFPAPLSGSTPRRG